MKVAIITDQHFGARKNSKLFHDYFLKFYQEVFFPYLEEHGIKTVIDMGDTFDSRKGIDFSALTWAKDNYYDRLEELGCTVHTIVGNHTAYYKNTNDVNAVDLLLREYGNVITYSEATEVKIDNLDVLFIPWINQENEETTLKKIQDSTCDCAMGHLELRGFRVNQQVVMEHGFSSELFKGYKNVFSGHYHTRSTDGTIHYLGNPYEMFANDVGDRRGFTIFDTETQEFFHVDNPFTLFEKIVYDDDSASMLDARPYENKIVKLVVRNKPRLKEFEKFIDKLYTAGVAELKIVENFVEEIGEDFEAFESEDTLSILNRYIEEAEINLDKSRVQHMMQEIYQEACELV